MTPDLAARLDPILDWFRDCIACQETVDNMNAELAPLGLVAHLDDRVMVIRRKAVARKPPPARARLRSYRRGAIEVHA